MLPTAPEANFRVAVDAVATSRPGKSGRGLWLAAAEHLGDVADQVAGEIDDVGRLLVDLAARLVLLPPPLRRRRRIEPIARQELRRVVGQDRLGFVDRVEVAPVIADPGDEAGGRDLSGDRLGDCEIERDGLFHEERKPPGSAARSGTPWAKGGTQI